MSLEPKLRTDKDGQPISLTLPNVKLNWCFLAQPDTSNGRQANPLEPKNQEEGEAVGKYRAQIIITDPKSVEVFSQYFTYVYEEAKQGIFKNVKDFWVPYREPNPSTYDIERDALLVLKGQSGYQPKLYLRLNGASDPRLATEEDIQTEFFSGIYADVIIRLQARTFPRFPMSKPTITCWLHAVCKTSDGEPQVSNIDYASDFSLDGGHISDFSQPKVAQPAPSVVPNQQASTPTQPNILSNLGLPKGTTKTEKPTLESILGNLNKTTTTTAQANEPIQQPTTAQANEPQNILANLINKGLK